MTPSPKAALCGVAFELGQLCDIAQAAAYGVSESDLLDLTSRGQQTFSRFDRPVIEAVQRCVLSTLEQTGVDPGQIDAVMVVTECFAGLSEGVEIVGEPAFRTARNRLFDGLTEIKVDRAAIFCATFGGSSNLLQALVLARPLIETGVYHRLLIICIDRLPDDEGRMMEAAVAITGDGVATCLICPAGQADGFVVDHVGVSPYAPVESRDGFARMVLEMYRATKVAAADSYEALDLQPADFVGLVLSNYNPATSQIFARLLGFDGDKVFLENVVRTGHVPACDPLINLRGLATVRPPAAGARLMLYINGPISCGVIALTVAPLLLTGAGCHDAVEAS